MEENESIPENESVKNEEKEIVNNVSDSQEGKITQKMRENPWVLSTFVLGILTLILLIGSFGGMTGGSITGGVVDEGTASDSVINFIKSQGADAEIVSVEEEGNFYVVTILFQDQEIPLYVTKDGEFLVQGLLPLNDIQQTALAPQQQSAEETISQFSDVDNLQIQEFSACVAQKGFRVYAADWCPHCEDLKDYFGGEENVEPFWVVCSDKDKNPTENAELCEKEGITGFPTMKLEGKVLSIPRTFEAIANVTGCTAPQLN